MARIKGGLNAKKKHNRILKMAMGHEAPVLSSTELLSSPLCAH